MKILIYGAGVIGSITAAKLMDAGYNTTLLARGKRLEQLQQNGLVTHNVISKETSTREIALTEQLNAEDRYDLIIVTVRLDQLQGAIESLKTNRGSKSLLFMLNIPVGVEQIAQELPDKHILLGFPGAGGTYRNGAIDYIELKQQKSSLGELNGKERGFSDLLIEVKRLFENSGMKVVLVRNMPAWLSIHALFVGCIAAAIWKANGDSRQLGKNKKSVYELVSSIREGFKACQTLGIPIYPTNLKTIFMSVPKCFAVWYWSRALQGEMGTLAMEPHVKSAKKEMQLIASQILHLVHSSSIATPSLDRLLKPFCMEQ